jgi:hypothetical protein
MEARRAHSSRFERVPEVATATKTNGRPCGETSRTPGIVCEGRTGRGFFPDQALDPEPRTIWRSHPRGRPCLGIMAQVA